MIRERTLKVVLVIVGLIFVAAVVPITMSLRQPTQSDPGDTMMLSIYFTLGIFLLLAARNPAANSSSSLILFAAWSSFAHAAVMALMALRNMGEYRDLLAGVALFAILGLPLLLLAPRRVPQPSLQNP